MKVSKLYVLSQLTVILILSSLAITASFAEDKSKAGGRPSHWVCTDLQYKSLYLPNQITCSIFVGSKWGDSAEKLKHCAEKVISASVDAQHTGNLYTAKTGILDIYLHAKTLPIQHWALQLSKHCQPN